MGSDVEEELEHTTRGTKTGFACNKEDQSLQDRRECPLRVACQETLVPVEIPAILAK
jgi:hypothetical protein